MTDTIRPPHTPEDSLIFLHQSGPLDWVVEKLLEEYTNDDDEFEDEVLGNIFALVEHARDMIRLEARHHNLLGKERYSNGCRVFTVTSEPQQDPDGSQWFVDTHRINHPSTGSNTHNK